MRTLQSTDTKEMFWFKNEHLGCQKEFAIKSSFKKIIKKFKKIIKYFCVGACALNSIEERLLVMYTYLCYFSKDTFLKRYFKEKCN